MTLCRIDNDFITRNSRVRNKISCWVNCVDLDNQNMITAHFYVLICAIALCHDNKHDYSSFLLQMIL